MWSSIGPADRGRPLGFRCRMKRRSLTWIALWWLAYVALLLAGWLSQRALWSILALAVLVTAVAWPGMARRRWRAWGGWAAAEALVLAAGLAGFGDLLLEAVPIVICTALAWWFARSLQHGRPLVSRCIAAIEGESRLAERGVARYARQLTGFWAGLMALQAIVMTVLWLGADGVGVLARLGLAPWPGIDARVAAAWLHVGGYALLPLVFVLEYAWRRWHLRHLRHPGLVSFLRQLARNWPRLVHGESAAAAGFTRVFCIPATHPALPGHFPGRPLVPGVVELEQVAMALRAWRGQRLTRVLDAKFVRPLLPAQRAQVRLTAVDAAVGRVQFEITRDGMVLARGNVEGAA